jgi:hypothetical protein
VIGVVDDVLYIKEITGFPAHLGTVVEGDALFLVNHEAQNPPVPFPAKLNIKKFQSHRRKQRFGKFPDSPDDRIHFFPPLGQL